MAQRVCCEELPELSDEISTFEDVDSGLGSSTPSPLTLLDGGSTYSTPESPLSSYSSSYHPNLDANSVVCSAPSESTFVSIWQSSKHHKDSVAEDVRQDKLGHSEEQKLCWKVRAATDFTAQQLILTEEPLVVLPCRPSSPERLICVNCGSYLRAGTPLPGKSNASCIICRWPVCENGCDFEEGTNYKNLHSSLECSMICESKIQWNGNPALYQCLWILRIAVMKRRDPMQFEQMLKLSDFGGKVTDRIYVTEETLCSLRKYMPMVDEFLTETELRQIFKILACKFRPMHFVGTVDKQLRALYLEAAAISHSCVPNVESWIDENYNQTLVATREIKVGEALTILFMDELVFMPAPERRRRLLEGYNFWCTCRRCADPTEFQTNFSLPVCRFSNVYFFKHCNSETPLWTCEHYLHPTNCLKFRSDYRCPSCFQVTLKDKIARWEIHFEGWMYCARDDLESLKKVLNKAYRTKKIHHTHFLFFRGSWRLLELLSEQLTQTEFLDQREYLKFIVPAESVYRIFKAFLPSDTSLASRVLRTVSLIKLAVLTEQIQEESLSISEVERRLEEVYFTNDINLGKIFKYHRTTRASDMHKFKGTFEHLEHSGIEKFVEAVRNYCIYKKTPAEGLQLLLTYILQN